MSEACAKCEKSLDAHEEGFGGYGCPTGGTFFTAKRPELYEGDDEEGPPADLKQVVYVDTPLWSDDEWIVSGESGIGRYKMTLAELAVLDLKRKSGKVSGPSLEDHATMHRSRTSDESCSCAICRHRQGKPLELFAINAPRGGSTFVKEFQFYIDQGGLRQAWGKNWIIVHADDMDGARVEAIRRSGFAGLYCRVCGKDTAEVCEHISRGS